MTITKQMEEYLATIYRLVSEQQAQRVSTGDVARALGVSSASATYMFKRLASQGLVDYEGYSGASLTEKGMGHALQLVRNHRLTERLLTDLLQFEWHLVDSLAHQLELGMPVAVADRIDALLGHPLTCPHGHPIPRKDGTIVHIPAVPLRNVQPGEIRQIVRVDNADASLLQYLAARHLVPGRKVEVISYNDLDSTMCVSVAGTESVIGERIYQCIAVEDPGTGPVVRTRGEMGVHRPLQ